MAEAAAGALVPPVTLADVQAAARLLEGVVRQTPMEHSRTLSELVGAEVYLKCENLQRAGSFKIRGAYTRMARLSPAQREAGVVAASAGNHAQGVALAARELGLAARIVMPVGAALPKVEATAGYGAQIELAGQSVDEALVRALEWSAQTGAVLVHPFDHPDVVAGQGTVGLEIMQQCPEVGTVVVCTGGGGLLAGIATAVKAIRPSVRVIGVQAEGAAAYQPSLAAGHPVALTRMVTMADGIAVGRPGDVPFALVKDLVDDIVTVGEEAISKALLHLLERAKLVVEPAGAAGVAAVLDGRLAGRLDGAPADGPSSGPEDRPALVPPVVVLLSGGNVDPLLLMRVIRHGMSAAGRYLQVRVSVPDQPGSLVALLAVLAAEQANVVEVAHSRTGRALTLHDVEVGLRLETRGPEHAQQVLDALERAGHRHRPW